MSQNAIDTSIVYPRLLPSFSSHLAVRQFLMKYPDVWNDFLKFPTHIQRELMDFCIGKNGLHITYDSVFRRIFQPENHKERLESLLSSILCKKVSILEILPRESTQEPTVLLLSIPLKITTFIPVPLLLIPVSILTMPGYMKIYLSALTIFIQSYIIYPKEVHCKKHGLLFSAPQIFILLRRLLNHFPCFCPFIRKSPILRKIQRS